MYVFLWIFCSFSSTYPGCNQTSPLCPHRHSAGSGTYCSHNSTWQITCVLDGNFMAKPSWESPSCLFVSMSFFSKQQMSLTCDFFFIKYGKLLPKVGTAGQTWYLTDAQLCFASNSIKLDIVSVLHNLYLAASSDQCFAFSPKDRGGVWLLSTLPDSYNDNWYCSYNEIKYQCFLAYWSFTSYISRFRSVYTECEVIIFPTHLLYKQPE